MSVDILGGQTPGQHEHLNVVQKLRKLLGGAVGAFVLRRHPGFRCLLDELLPDGVNALIEPLHRPGTRLPGRCLVGQLGEQLVESLHNPKGTG